MIALAFLAGLWTATRRARRENISGEKIADIVLWLMIGAIIGARFVYVTTYWKDEFADQPFSEIFMIQHGGLVYYGGLIGATIAGIIYIRWKKLPLWKIADVLAPSIALGNVFGRIGCLLNGCCYGRACSLPWAIRFPADHINSWRAGASDGNLRRAVEFHPLPFSGLAVPPQKIRRPGVRHLSHRLRRLPLHRGMFPRRLSARPHPLRPHAGQLVSIPIFIAGLALAALLSRRVEVKRG